MSGGTPSKMLRRTSGVLTLGGGFLGATVISAQLLSGAHGALAIGLMVLFALAYTWGIAAGLLILEGSKYGVSMSLPYWLIQIPSLSSPWLYFEFYSGAFVVVSIGGFGLNYNAMVGSRFNFFFAGEAPWAIGVNLVALALFVWLLKSGRQ